MINRERFRQGLLHAKKRVKRHWYQNGHWYDNESEKDFNEALKRHRKTTKRCSGVCCANRRFWEGDTKQEKLSKYELKHWDKEKFDDNEDPFWDEH